MKKLILIFVLLPTVSLMAKPNNSFWLSLVKIEIINYLQIPTPPVFPGGEEAFHIYLNNNIKWPTYKDKDTLKSMLLTFFVEKDGTLSGLKVEKSWSPEFDAQVVHLVANSPRWIPAMRNNNPIKSKYSLPINFRSTHQITDAH